MKPRSAKAKGRAWCKEVKKQLMQQFADAIDESDITIMPTSYPGEDLKFTSRVRHVLDNTSFECKHDLGISVWQAYHQAQANAGKYTPVVAMKKHKDEIAVLHLEFCIKLLRDSYNLKQLLASREVEEVK